MAYAARCGHGRRGVSRTSRGGGWADVSETLAIRGGRGIDPANGVAAVAAVLIVDGRVAAVGPDAGKDASQAIDARGLVVCPGFVDIHCHLREPGFEHKETIATGTLAAARGGFTTVCAMPNTEPPIDSAAGVAFILRTAQTAGGARDGGGVPPRLGLKGVPASAEETMVARNVALAEETGSHVHIAHVSTAGSVELIRRANARGVAVTA